MIYWSTNIDNNLYYTKLKVKTKIKYDQMLQKWAFATTLQLTQYTEIK